MFVKINIVYGFYENGTDFDQKQANSKIFQYANILAVQCINILVFFLRFFHFTLRILINPLTDSFKDQIYSCVPVSILQMFCKIQQRVVFTSPLAPQTKIEHLNSCRKKPATILKNLLNRRQRDLAVSCGFSFSQFPGQTQDNH